ncbi:NAD(P)-dependent oxidoreductase [Rhizobium sp. AQ_MP]|uniref:NAD-dependent epimerase/dehydratase family protein n=1 Tax=Rhizobium sp. AQ_MP TaxID=2761536 RepID=UPI00163A24A0|nr:NAD(P)-dependent oxidoreductase [Rhizobium sp. AQ_MP]MBC2774567.1 NAD(P)-dependent oxidoreductase [Rhizobium sp. AQ_MP]
MSVGGGHLKRETIYLTGASGFIGQALARALVSKGHGVVATDVMPPRQPLPDGVPFHLADVRDVGLHAAKIAGQCDSIVHCGGISGPMLLNHNPAEVLDINVRGTSQLLALASNLGLRRFVSLSSVSAYGDTPGLAVVNEDAPLSASTFYGTSKAASDLIVQTFARQAALSAVCLRIGWVYGPGRMTDALIQPIVRSSRGERYAIDAGADQILQFVHVEDVVSAIIAALAAATLPFAAYNINGRETVRVGDMLGAIRRQLPGVTASIGPGPLPGADQQAPMSIEAARRDLGWEPSVPFPSGLAAYVDWLREHPH